MKKKTIGEEPDKKSEKAMEKIDKILIAGGFTMMEGFNILASMLVQSMAFYIINDSKNKYAIKKIYSALEQLPSIVKDLVKADKT